MTSNETALKNTTAAPIPVALRSLWEVDPGDLTRVGVRYRTRDGRIVNFG